MLFSLLFLFISLHRGASALTADHIAEFGVLRKGLDKDDVKDLSAAAREELYLHEEDLDKESAKQLFESGQGRLTSRRKRAIIPGRVYPQ